MRRFSPRTWSMLIIGSMLLVTGAFAASPQLAFAEGAGPGLQGAPAEATPSKDPPKGWIETAADFLGGVALSPVVGMAFVILAGSNVILSIVSSVFEFAVQKLVFGFSSFIGNSPGMLISWSVLRDFGNIFLLFGFVFIGIQTILNIGHFSVGKALPRLVMFAVLLNFSLFAAEAVIDASNVVAFSLYKQAYATDCAPGDDNCLVSTGIAAKINEAAGLQTVFGGDLGAGLAEYFDNPVRTIIRFVGLSIFVTTAWVVLLAGAVLLISRAVVLGFIMITAPIGFAGMAVPGLNKIANDWWKALINNAVFAPAYLVLILVSLKIMSAVSSLSGNSLHPDLGAVASAGSPGDMGGALVFALVIGFLIAALLVAKRLGIYGADAVVKQATGFVGNTAGFMTFGALGRTGRFVVGRPANRLAQNIRSGRFGTTIPGQILAKGLDVAATKSFDARGTKAFGTTLGKVGDYAKEGRRGELKKISEQASKDAEALKKAREASYKPFEKKAAEFSDSADSARAKATEAETEADELEKRAAEEQARGNPTAAANFAAQAMQKRREAAEHENMARDAETNMKGAQQELANKKVSNLSEEERRLQAYRAKGGAAGAAEIDQEKKIAEYTEKINRSMNEAAEAAEKIAKAQEDIRGGFVAPENMAAKQLELEAAQEQLEAAETAQQTAKDNQEAAQKQLERMRKEREKGMRESGNKMLKAEYAMQQLADTFDRTAKTLGRIPLAGGALGAGAYRARAEAAVTNVGKSKIERLFQELEHEVVHGQKHDAHAEEPHAAPAAPSAAPSAAHPPAH